MSTLFLILLGISLAHFVYEGILAPSLRMSLRNELFVLRDKLRRMKIDHAIRDDEFAVLHDGVNFLLPRLSSITMTHAGMVIETMKRDEELKKLSKKRSKIIEASENRVVPTYSKEIFLIYLKALACNSMACIIYFLPFLLLVVFFTKSVKALKSALLLPYYVAEKISPVDRPAYAEA